MIEILKNLHTYHDRYPYYNEMINIGMNGIMGPGKKMSSCVYRAGDLVTNMYININKLNDKYNHNLYKLINSIELMIGGRTIMTISIEYITFYYKIIKDIDINIFSNGSSTIIPIDLKSMFNIPFILLPYFNEYRIYIITNKLDIFNYEYMRKISLDSKFPNYNSYVNILPKDVWRLILNILDDKTWANLRQSCKFFYSLDYDRNIINRYEKYKIDFNDLNDFDCHTTFMYGLLSNLHRDYIKPNSEKPKYEFFNEYRDIGYINIDLKNQIEHIIAFKTEIFVEWIIIKINNCEKDIINSIEFIEKDYIEQDIFPEKINHIDKSCKHMLSDDPIFYNKVHNVNENRYMIFNKNNKLITGFILKFKKEIYAKIDIFISEKMCLLLRDDYCVPFSRYRKN